MLKKHLNHISVPMMDRIDLHVEVFTVSSNQLSEQEDAEPSTAIRERVEKARQIQSKRFEENVEVHIILTGKIFVTLGKTCSNNCTKRPEYHNLTILSPKHF